MAKPNIDVKIRNRKEFQTTLKKTWPDFTRFAVANTASRVAFLGMEKSENEWRRDFTLRNKFLISSKPGKGALKFNRAIPHHDLNKIKSSWGSPEKRGASSLEFLEDQEEGFTQRKFTPAINARVSKNEAKKIKTNLRRNAIEIMSSGGFPGKNKRQQMVFFMRQAFLNSFAMPGSKQFIYIHDNEFGGFREGLYQFKSRNLSGGQFPRIRAIYYKRDKRGQKRKATHWMKNSANAFRQTEIDRIYAQEFNLAFTRRIKRRW